MRRLTSLSKQISFNFCSSNPIVESVLFSQERHFAKVVLNKPKALNALDLPMIRAISGKVAAWTQSDVKAVWICGAGGKAFCAGGDVRSLYDAKVGGKAEDQWILNSFFREEFTLDYNLSKMSPTQIAVMDGFVMGGGVGISVHAPIRIATENSVFAMPEARLGFFTDVAGGYFLSRLRSNIGLYLGLTGARLKGKELVATGVANYYVPREKLEALEADVKNSLAATSSVADIKSIVQKYAEPVSSAYNNEEQIAKLFAGKDLATVLKNLEESSSEFATETKKLLKDQNAISLRVIYEQIARGGKTDLRENFKSDFRLTQRFIEGSDFFEGIRTVLVDKKDTPKWTYKQPGEVPQALVDSYFLPLPADRELAI